MEISWGYCAIHHKHIDDVLKLMEKYEVNKYLIGLETCKEHHKVTDGEHMHFILYISPQSKQFKNLREKLRDTYQLAGKNNKKGKAFYGWKTDEIKSIEKLSAYTCKDKNVRYKNITEEEIQQYFEMSYPKVPERNIYKECIQAINQQRPYINVASDHTSLYLNTIQLEIFILKFHMDNGIKICKSKIKNIALSFLQLEFNDRYKHLEEIYNYTIK